MSKKQFRSLHEAFLETLSEVYGSDSYNTIYNEFNGTDIETYKRKLGYARAPESLIQRYRLHPIILIASFFGLPNRWDYNEKISLWKIFKNFLGWEEYKTPGRILFNILKMPIVLPLNIVMAILLTAQNIVKIPTEFLPLLFTNICRYYERQFNAMLNNMKKNESDPANSFKSLIKFLSFLANLLKKLFKGLHFVGRAVTSPVSGVMSAWNSTDDKILAFFKAAGSLAITVVFYCFLIPTVPVVLANLGLPAFIPDVPFLSFIGNNVVLPLIGGTLAAIGESVLPVVTGLAFCIAAALTVIGPIIFRCIDYFNYYWRNSGESGDRFRPGYKKPSLMNRTRKFFNHLCGKEDMSHTEEPEADHVNEETASEESTHASLLSRSDFSAEEKVKVRIFSEDGFAFVESADDSSSLCESLHDEKDVMTDEDIVHRCSLG